MAKKRCQLVIDPKTGAKCNAITSKGHSPNLLQCRTLPKSVSAPKKKENLNVVTPRRGEPIAGIRKAKHKGTGGGAG